MNFRSYSKLYDIYTEEKANQKLLPLKLLFTSLFWISLLFILLAYFEVKTGTFLTYYLSVLTVIELLLLFVFMALYESTSYIISFSKNIPIKPSQLFFYHLIKSNVTAEILIELTLVSGFLLYFGASMGGIFLLLFFIFTLKFLRTYAEFLILWIKKYQVRFPYFTMIAFFVLLIFYINSIELFSLLSKIEFTITNIVLILFTLLVIAFFTFPTIVGGLIKEKTANLNSQKFNSIVNRFSGKLINLFIRNQELNSLIKYNFLRLLRDVGYISKLIAISIAVLIVNIIGIYAPSLRMENVQTNLLVDTIYMAFFVNFLNLTNIKIDFRLHQRLKLTILPVSLKTERIAVDMTSSFFLFVTFTFLLLLKMLVESLPLIYFLDGYKAFYCFLILSLLLDCFYKYEIQKKIKSSMIIMFLVIGILIEILFIIKVIFIIQLSILAILTLTLYFLRYREKKNKFNNLLHNGNSFN